MIGQVFAKVLGLRGPIHKSIVVVLILACEHAGHASVVARSVNGG